jgi:hypothetical protein
VRPPAAHHHANPVRACRRIAPGCLPTPRRSRPAEAYCYANRAAQRPWQKERGARHTAYRQCLSSEGQPQCRPRVPPPTPHLYAGVKASFRRSRVRVERRLRTRRRRRQRIYAQERPTAAPTEGMAKRACPEGAQDTIPGRASICRQCAVRRHEHAIPPISPEPRKPLHSGEGLPSRRLGQQRPRPQSASRRRQPGHR